MTTISLREAPGRPVGHADRMSSAAALAAALDDDDGPARRQQPWPSTRRAATVLMSDIVGSTALAAALGDRRWRRVLQAHDTIVRDALIRFGGEEVVHTGDGIVATFDGPSRAVTCAQSMVAALGDLGLTARVGLHAGEVETGAQGVTGLAIHVAARVMATADRGGVVVSRTVKELVLGSGLTFADLGEHELRGVPGRWALFEVVPGTASSPLRTTATQLSVVRGAADGRA